MRQETGKTGGGAMRANGIVELVVAEVRLDTHLCQKLQARGNESEWHICRVGGGRSDMRKERGPSELCTREAGRVKK